MRSSYRQPNFPTKPSRSARKEEELPSTSQPNLHIQPGRRRNYPSQDFPTKTLFSTRKKEEQLSPVSSASPSNPRTQPGSRRDSFLPSYLFIWHSRRTRFEFSDLQANLEFEFEFEYAGSGSNLKAAISRYLLIRILGKDENILTSILKLFWNMIIAGTRSV